MHSDDIILDRLILAYRVNYRVLQDAERGQYPGYSTEQILIDMSALWIEMVERIPESHSLRILSLVYGGS